MLGRTRLFFTYQVSKEFDVSNSYVRRYPDDPNLPGGTQIGSIMGSVTDGNYLISLGVDYWGFRKHVSSEDFGTYTSCVVTPKVFEKLKLEDGRFYWNLVSFEVWQDCNKMVFSKFHLPP